VREPWVRFEDDQLLVVVKPAGVNTHQADAHAQDGMYEWVQRQRPGVSLSILHRLDKVTSGLLVFGKTTAANQSLARQFETRSLAKRYELVVPRDDRRADALRCDDRIGTPGQDAVTDFQRQHVGPQVERYGAWPHTGRTHQVRIHAAALGMPIIGDPEYGGMASSRLFLHAAGLEFDHPTAGRSELSADRPPSFDRVVAGADPAGASLAALVAHEHRAVLFDPVETDAYLWIDRHHDGFGRLRLERLGHVALALHYDEGSAALAPEWLDAWNDTLDLRAVYEQRRPRGGGGGEARRVSGSAPPRFEVVELGLRYLIDLEASATSSGLFLDQRETRRRLLSGELAGKTVLNVFAHTGSLSVAAASAGAETLTLDLSKHYLDWARENLRLNAIAPEDHDFVFGDALEWMDRFAKKGRTFDLVLVDPPSSSTAKRGGKRWVVERDLHALVTRGAQLCAPGGTLFVSTNLHRMRWPGFLEQIAKGLTAAGRTAAVETQTLPLDHRSGSGDPPYLKAAWIRLDVDRDRAENRTPASTAVPVMIDGEH